MMTEKLFYKDSYISEFEAEVVSYLQVEDGFDLALSKTAFFPESGGQSSDSGYIGDSIVTYVYEKDEVIYHRVNKLPEGKHVSCKINFAERFDKMQQHTAEHILCGIIHRLYGYDNVGFHLGDDVVTFDINHPLTKEQIDLVEELANQAVFQNIKVETSFPAADKLEKMLYRSKLDFLDNVRIVKIGDVDSCACCAPHVNYTGEIGLIKCLDFMSHRGGVRITMCAGSRALRDYREKYRNIREISAMLCEPQSTTSDGLKKYMLDREKDRFELRTIKKAYAESLASAVSAEKNYVIVLENLDMDDAREFANRSVLNVGGIVVALIGKENDYKYIMASRTKDLRSMSKDINQKLNGRGGGQPQMIQGSLFTTLEKIKEYFDC